MNPAPRRVYEMQKARVKKLVACGMIDEISAAIDSLSISTREKIVLRALMSKELVKGQIGNTAKEILEETGKTNETSRGSMIGVKIWTVLTQLTERRLIQTIENHPKLYILNRELNPIRRMQYPYSLLETLYDVLPELKSCQSEVSCRVRPEDLVSSSSGAYSTNEEWIKILVDMMGLANEEILNTSLQAQTLDQYPIFLYSLGNAIERGVQAYSLLSTRVSSDKIDGYKKVGAIVKVVEEETLSRHGIPNIVVVDRRHFMEINKYEYEHGEKIRFGVWRKYNKPIAAKYVNTFWQVWKKEAI